MWWKICKITFCIDFVECVKNIHHSKKKNPKILSVKNDFHGIMSYSNILTTRFYPITTKMDGFLGGISHLNP